MAITRRDFLKRLLGTATLASLGSTSPALVVRSALAGARTDERDTVLVVLELPGGNDTLNTVVPYAADEYARSRRTLRLSASQVLKIDSLLGFHPSMPGFARLWKEGRLSVVQGVGYPRPDDNHPGAMRIWQTAAADRQPCQTGWLGRAVDTLSLGKEEIAPAVLVSQTSRRLALNAERAFVPRINAIQEGAVRAATQPESGEGLQGISAGQAGETPLLDYVRRTTLAACAGSRQIERAARARTAEYPAYPLAGRLRTISQLIRADLGIRIFYTEESGEGIGGFDTHAGQRDNHAALLKQLSESVTAFVDDLAGDRLLDRVLVMTFSEFGRTLVENGRRGTGHGAAQSIFLVGGKVRGGLVGAHPSLADLDSQGGLKFHTDFRRVYATVLETWLGLDSRAVLGARFEPLNVVL